MTVVILGSLMGVVFERFRLCMSSTVTDSVLLGDRSKLRGLVFGVLVSAAAFNALIGAGVMKSIAEPLSPMTVVAGVVFGLGMTLAGGCVSGTLFKMGQGYVASLLAFLGLVLGFGTMGYLIQFMTRPWEESQAPRWTDMTLAQLLGVSPHLVAIPAAIACAALVWLWRRGGKLGAPELTPVVGWTLVAILNTLYFAVLRQPLGVGGTPVYAASGLSYLVDPAWTLANPMLGLVLGIPRIAIPGAAFFAGATLSAVAGGRFHARLPVARQAASSIAGGFLMGLATTMMVGCNVTHILGGLPQLALSSLAATAGIAGGAWAAAMLLSRLPARHHGPTSVHGLASTAVGSPTAAS